ncbi:MAG: twin-arginine translocation signal domain-containing protein, partial [Steroidobacteraceae bacterium]
MKKRKIGTPDGNATLMAELSRRGFLRGGAAGAVGLALGPTPIAHAAMGKGSDRLSVSQDGRYATVPLVK